MSANFGGIDSGTGQPSDTTLNPYSWVQGGRGNTSWDIPSTLPPGVDPNELNSWVAQNPSPEGMNWSPIFGLPGSGNPQFSWAQSGGPAQDVIDSKWMMNHPGQQPPQQPIDPFRFAGGIRDPMGLLGQQQGIGGMPAPQVNPVRVMGADYGLLGQPIDPLNNPRASTPFMHARGGRSV